MAIYAAIKKSKNPIVSRKFLYIIIYTSGPKKLLRFKAAGCSAQRDFKGEKVALPLSPP
jgi:hypothetical protein